MEDNKLVYLMFGVFLVAIVAEQMPDIGGWLLLVVVLGALVVNRAEINHPGSTW
jgi:hypothetical protein